MLPSLIGIIASSGGAAASANSYESIATTTVGAGGASTVTFSSIPNTYKHLQIRTFANNSTTVAVNYTFNNDSGSNYAWHAIYGDGSSSATLSGTTQTSMNNLAYASTTANVYFAGVIDVLDYANTNKYKTARSLTGWDTNGGGSIHLRSGLWQSTSAVSTITIAAASSSFAQYSSFALYGVK